MMRRSYRSILLMMIERQAVLMADCVGLAELISWMFRGRNGGRRGPAKGKVFAWMRDSRIRKERNCHLASSPVIRVAPTLNVVTLMKVTRYAHSQIESDKCR